MKILRCDNPIVTKMVCNIPRESNATRVTGPGAFDCRVNHLVPRLVALLAFLTTCGADFQPNLTRLFSPTIRYKGSIRRVSERMIGPVSNCS
jgi:hypothetical protein